MSEWHRKLQEIIDRIDEGIRQGWEDSLALCRLSREMGYSEFYFSRKFREISGMAFREYLRARRLAFALKELRDSNRGILEIALNYGFSSHEAFSRSFKKLYGITPSEYRRHPIPVALRTVIRPFDCYLSENGGFGMTPTNDKVKTYFVTIPAHKFLHIKNYESIGYWDFWQKMGAIPGMDCETICGLLASIPGKLDDLGADDISSGSGQIMAFLNDPIGRICSWGIPLAECYGVRLPLDYSGEIPPQMLLIDVPEGEYIVFEHGPFNYTDQNCDVEEKIEEAMKQFDYSQTEYELDRTEGRIFYFYHDPARFWKYIRPVRRK